MKNKLALILALTICASAFTGCAGASSGESSKAADSSAEVGETADNSGDTIAEETASEKLLAEYPVNDGAYDFKQGATENMLARSLLNRGNTSRLAAKIQRAVDDPKAVTNICYLGDSITAGSGASGSAKQYTNLITAWWEENLSLYVLGTNAGIGATDSYLAVHRAYRDVPPESDIVFIEFINDQDSEFYQATMDSLVRYCLALENQPAVILIEPSTEGGGSPQSAHLKVAETYDLPMISYHDAIIPEIDAGNFAWKDTSNDNVHPNDAGHAVMAQCVLNLFDQVKDGTGDRFAGATLGSADTPELVEVVDAGTFTESAQFGNFSGGWGSTTGGSAVFKIKCKDLGILYHKNISGTFGKVAVKVDDNAAVIVDGDFPGGWGNYPKAEEIFSSDETAEHTVKVEFINGDTAPDFEILGWMIS